MNRTRTVCIVIVLAIAAAGWLAGETTVGQGPADETSENNTVCADRGTTVAVIGMMRVFHENAAFQSRLQDMKREVDAYSKNVEVRQAEIESLQKKLPNLKPGSVEHDKGQLLLTRLQTELKLQVTRRKQEFLKRETALYHETYGKVTAAVTKYAKDNGIQLVLRFNEEKVNPEDQKSVLGAVNRTVVYQEGLDITDEIIADLNSEDEPPAEI